MRALSFALAAAATLTSAGLAFAQPARLTDGQYLAAARCAGLADGAGSSDYDAFMREQSKRRQTAVLERADKIRDKAAHSARIANDNQKGVFAAELAGQCRTLNTSVASTSN
jgi:hypothetical protein